jgi:hypothetical protein
VSGCEQLSDVTGSSLTDLVLEPDPGTWLPRYDGDYLLLFKLGGASVTLALAIDLVTALTVARKHRDNG